MRFIETIVHLVPFCGNFQVKLLERKLQGKLDDSPSVLVDDLAEVMKSVTSVTGPSVGVAEPASRIARIGNVGPITIRNVDTPQANRIQRQKDVASG